MIGAGVAGASCAQALALAGLSVHLFDKSHGPGGRLATRRVEWVDRQGQPRITRLDHGAVAVTARSQDFRAFVDRALQAGWLAEWAPEPAAGSLPAEDGDRLYLPVPDLPALCSHMSRGIDASWSFAIDGLHRDGPGWRLQSGGERHHSRFDAVVLALPPAQAAPLVAPHRSDWARHASVVPMQPCWTLMGIADAGDPAPAWDLARPSTGPLDWVLRNEARPGRDVVPGHACWVVHARAGWSRRHLEQPAVWVQQQLQAALAEFLGRPVDWLHCVVHRWRYAAVRWCAVSRRPTSCWWDASLGLGVCGDYSRRHRRRGRLAVRAIDVGGAAP